ncbi:MAG: undecaprenyl diphosphate synthase family protein [archaeon]
MKIPILPTRKKNEKKLLHVAVSTSRLKRWTQLYDKSMSDAVKLHICRIKEFMSYQLKYDFPILTIKLGTKNDEQRAALARFFKELVEDKTIHKNQVRVFIIGTWFDLPVELVDALKKVMEKTQHYDKYFLNFCIHYDGQSEIVAAMRLIARRITAGKMEIEDINKDTIKENLYSSYFTPPDIIIECSRKYSGLLQWDSRKSLIYFSHKLWLDFDKTDFKKVLDFWKEE